MTDSDKPAWIVHNVAPLRASPDGGSEQISQAILGEGVMRLAERDNYVYVRMADGYEGWVWREHLGPVGPSAEIAGRNWGDLLCGPGAVIRYVSSGITDLLPGAAEPDIPLTKLVLGTRLLVVGTGSFEPGAADPEAGPFIKVETPFAAPERSDDATTVGYVAVRDTAPGTAEGYPGRYSGAAACALALRFVGIPYLWGGVTPFGFDCSGFVQRIYGMLNVPLPRDAYLQARSPGGAILTPDQTLQAGDLIFFCGRSDPHGRGITHVGMALDQERFVHAYGKRGVVVTRFDDPLCCSAYTYISAWRYCAAGGPSSL